MSSNVGLSTPRGSGTSGYVQRNLSHLKPRNGTSSAPYPSPRDSQALAKHRARQPDKDILLHEKKREVEVKCFELRDKLEEEGKTDKDEIEEQVDSLRKKLLEELERGGGGVGDAGRKRAGLKSHQVHELAEAKEREMRRIEQALGISPNYEEGSHWQKQAQRKFYRELGDPLNDTGMRRE
ncbi:cwf21 domain-containing protein [Terfezia claveryi]|nr:cwf21 domain-containing protein [Terfezia claveryi]